MTRKTTFGNIHRLLERFGFTRRTIEGGYVVFEHPTANVLLAFRKHTTRELVDPMTFGIVRWRLIRHGFLEDDEAFYLALREASTNGQPKAHSEKQG